MGAAGAGCSVHGGTADRNERKVLDKHASRRPQKACLTSNHDDDVGSKDNHHKTTTSAGQTSPHERTNGTPPPSLYTSSRFFPLCSPSHTSQIVGEIVEAARDPRQRLRRPRWSARLARRPLVQLLQGSNDNAAAYRRSNASTANTSSSSSTCCCFVVGWGAGIGAGLVAGAIIGRRLQHRVGRAGVARRFCRGGEKVERRR